MEWKTTSLLRIFLHAKVLYSILHLQEWLKLSKVNGESIFNYHVGNLFITHIVKIKHTVFLKYDHFFPMPQA